LSEFDHKVYEKRKCKTKTIVDRIAKWADLSIPGIVVFLKKPHHGAAQGSTYIPSWLARIMQKLNPKRHEN
jgi:hypothetical protein